MRLTVLFFSSLFCQLTLAGIELITDGALLFVLPDNRLSVNREDREECAICYESSQLYLTNKDSLIADPVSDFGDGYDEDEDGDKGKYIFNNRVSIDKKNSFVIKDKAKNSEKKLKLFEALCSVCFKSLYDSRFFERRGNIYYFSSLHRAHYDVPYFDNIVGWCLKNEERIRRQQESGDDFRKTIDLRDRALDELNKTKNFIFDFQGGNLSKEDFERELNDLGDFVDAADILGW
ncbi:MAG: hypothetical protein OXE99_04600 [Cellvibrionales bacterium]|nr:hypothetical protein [Cellvibrionales bacterium]